MNYMNKDKKWLIRFCDKLKEELSFCKERVEMAEKIMHDLKATGQESVESLIKTIDGFEAKKLRLESEIASASGIMQVKQDMYDLREKKVADCRNFIETHSEYQEKKIEDLNNKIFDKKEYILDLKRQVVSLEYKSEAQENALVDLDRKIGNIRFSD
jgi:histidinol dehydrogenase